VKDHTFHIESMKAQKQGHRNLAFNDPYFTVLASFLKFMTSSSLLLALNGVMMVVFGFYLYSFKIVPSLLVAAFLVIFAVYGLNKFTDKTEDLINRPENSCISSNYYLILSIASMLTGFFIGLMDGIEVFLILVTPVIIGVGYSVKISKSVPRLKEIVGVKSIIVALSWALTGCLLPESIGVTKLQASLIVFGYIFIRVFVGTILCDLLDRKGDLASGIETIPTKLGKCKTKKFLVLVNSLGLLLAIYCQLAGIFIQFIPAMLFGVVYGYFAIWFFFKENCKRSIGGLILDGEWLPIVIIACLLIR
jgi:4-hydroxybenzoate polyprenyltransferase